MSSDSQIIIALAVVMAVISIGLMIGYNRSGKQGEAKRVDELIQSAHLERQKGSYSQEEFLLLRALEILDSVPSPDFSKYSSCLVNLADALSKQGRHAEARQAYAKLLANWEGALTNGSSDRLTDLDYFVSTADFASGTNDVANFYRKLLDRKKQTYGASHPEIANSMLIYARLLNKIGEKAQAEQIEKEARAMQGKA